MSSFLKCLLGITVLVIASGCAASAPHTHAQAKSPTKSEAQVDSALAQYAGLLRRMDATGLSQMYDVNGEGSHESQPPVVGREALRKLFESFASFKVLDYDLHANSTVAAGDSATQLGNYRQWVVVPAGDTVKVAGTFKADWVREPDHRWLLRSMHTTSGALPR